MARRITAPSEPKPAALSRVKMRTAISRLKRRIVDLRAFDPATLNDRYDARIGALERAIDKVLVRIFGADTVDYRRYSGAKRLDQAGHLVGCMPPLKEIREGFQRGKNDSISLLEEIITQIKAKLELTI
jgi:hypothetical protein